MGKLLLRLSIPGIISMVSVSLYNLVDSFWVAKLGYQSLAALTIVMPYFILVLAVGLGSGVGLNVLISRRFGERDIVGGNRAAGQIVPLALLLGSLFLLIATLFTDPVLKILGATPDILDLGHQYLFIKAFSYPFLIFQLMARNIVQASGDPVRPMIFSLSAQLLNVILDPFLIFGWWIFPEMGIGGAALATVISSGVGCSLAVFYIFTNRTVFRLKPQYFKPRISEIKEIYRVGFPSMLTQITESFVFILFNRVVAGYGSVALAAMGIAMRIADTAFIPVLGVANSVLPIVGYSLGARLWKRLWGVIRMSSLWLTGVMLGVTVIMQIFTAQIVAAFNDDPELLSVAVPGMRIFLSSLPIVAPTIVFIIAFQGLAKGKDVLVLSLARQLLFFLPALWLLPRYLDLTGVWLSWPVSDLAGFITAGFWIWREYRHQKKSGLWLQKPASHHLP